MLRDEEVEKGGRKGGGGGKGVGWGGKRRGKGYDCRFGTVIFSLAWGLTIYFLVCRLLRFFFVLVLEKKKGRVRVLLLFLFVYCFYTIL